MHVETDYYVAAKERDILREMYRLFPRQIVGHPRAYHTFPDGRILRYKVYGHMDDTEEAVLFTLMAKLNELQQEYPNSSLYWRRMPEFCREKDFESDKYKFKATVRIAIDHPNWKNDSDYG